MLTKGKVIVLAIVAVALAAGVIWYMGNNQSKSDVKETIKEPYVQIAKDYIDASNFAAKDKIDYSIYLINNLDIDQYNSGGYITEDKITEENIKDYKQIIVGDTQIDTDTGAHNYAVLLIDTRSEEIRGYAPTK